MRRWSLIVIITSLLVACGATSVPPQSPTPSAAPAPTATRIPTRTPPVATITPPPMATPLPPSATPTPVLPSYDLVLRGGTLIDGTGSPPLADAVIAIRDGRIAAVGPAATLPFAPDTPVRDLPGTTFLPGFINAHAHTWTLADDELRGWTRAGVTTIRDLSGPRELLVARRDAFAADPSMPRLFVAGPMVTVERGHPIPLYGLNDRVQTVNGAENATQTINTLLDDGVDLIKIAVSGRTDTAWPELLDEEIRAITETAHARGARVTAHVDRSIALRRAVLNGIDDAAHMPRDRMPDELIAEMVARNVALVPTIDVYEGLAEERGNVAEWRRTTLPVMYDNLRRFAAAGGTLALGDDYGNPRVALGMPMPEIEHWLAAGLTPTQVIVAATHGSAIVCGRDDQIGRLLPGMAADILVVNGAPLEEIGALARPVLVLRDGAVAFVAGSNGP